MPKKIYTTLPVHYPVCIHSHCPKAATCLHQMAYPTLVKTQELLRLVNPERATADNHCPHYRSSEPVNYAFGFTNFQTHMYPEQYHTFITILRARFGRNAYFDRRCGKRPIPPEEQHIIHAALRKAGITQPLPFDRYEPRTNWYD